MLTIVSKSTSFKVHKKYKNIRLNKRYMNCSSTLWRTDWHCFRTFTFHSNGTTISLVRIRLWADWHPTYDDSESCDKIYAHAFYTSNGWLYRMYVICIEPIIASVCQIIEEILKDTVRVGYVRSSQYNVSRSNVLPSGVGWLRAGGVRTPGARLEQRVVATLATVPGLSRFCRGASFGSDALTYKLTKLQWELLF